LNLAQAETCIYFFAMISLTAFGCDWSQDVPIREAGHLVIQRCPDLGLPELPQCVIRDAAPSRENPGPLDSGPDVGQASRDGLSDGNLDKLKDGPAAADALDQSTGEAAPLTGPPLEECWKIQKCYEQCAVRDSQCIINCKKRGSEEARLLNDHLQRCINTYKSPGGYCYLHCQSITPGACTKCLQTACFKEMVDCWGGYGPYIPTVGDPCDAQTPCPFKELTCSGSPKGYCGFECHQPGTFCYGTPYGTLTACLADQENSPKGFCRFICRLDDKTFGCPKNHICSESPIKQSSNIFLCVPQ
jgi:hypothetical protein